MNSKPDNESPAPSPTEQEGIEPGGFGSEEVGPALLQSATGGLDPGEVEALWELFQQVGRTWDNVLNDSAGQRSSWLEFVTLRCHETPSYLEEYRSAIRVIQQLINRYGLIDGYRRLFTDVELRKATGKQTGIKTRLHHAKFYVVDEFIRVQMVAGGFRGFGGKNRAYNYNGFIRGTRYNRVQRVRTYRPKKAGEQKREPS